MQRFNPKRVPADFLQALKNTPQLPSKPKTTSNENVMPMSKHLNMPKQIPPKTQTVTKGTQNTTQNAEKSRIKQDDFTKISQSYVLDGNFLKKYETKNMTVISNVRTRNHKQSMSNVPTEATGKKQGLVSFQQKVKLEYLEEKGFLKPQQKMRLQQARKQKEFPLQPIKEKIMNMNMREEQERGMKKRQYTSPQEMQHYYKCAHIEQEGSDQDEYYPAYHYGNSAHHYGAYGYPQPKSQQMHRTASMKPNREQQAYYRSARGQQTEKEPKIMVTAPKDLQPTYQQEDQGLQHQEFRNRHKMVPSDMHFTHHYPPHMSMKPNQKMPKSKQYYDNYCYPPHYGQSTNQRRFEQRSEPKKPAKRYEEPFGYSNYHANKKNTSAFYQNPNTYGKSYY